MADSELRRYAAFLLGRQDYSIGTLRQKLRDRGAPPAAIEALLNELISHGYLNDERYAHNLIISCRARGLSDKAIRLKLLSKQLSPNHLEEMPEDPLESAKRAWAKISKRYNLSDLKDRQRAAAALARRGFSWDTISSLMRSTETGGANTLRS
ncbi:MAG: regulatory protein RecX [Parachlamydiales bacterium]